MTILTSTNPAKNYAPIGSVGISSVGEVVESVAKAHGAREYWSELAVAERVKLLRPIYDAFKYRKDEIGELLTSEMGMPVSVRDAIELTSGLDYFKWYLDNAEKILAPEVSFEDDIQKHTVYFEATGVAAVIAPWNYPFSQFIWGVIPNLVAGNPVVFKHSENCPLTGKLLADIIKEISLPEGVFAEVYGNNTVGDLLVNQDINLICFTGSTKVGKYLYQVASEKFIKVVLELGGSAPGIVFEDADLDVAVEQIYNNRFSNSGQTCDALKRLIVHESKVEELLARLKTLVEAKKVGDPTDLQTDLGPLSSQGQLETLQEQVKDAVAKGATVVTGGKQPEGLPGAFYLPTILTNVNSSMKVWQEEVFGPVLPIMPFKSEEEAVALANDTKYGLGSYVFTKDKKKAARVAAKLKTGMVSVNNAYYVVPQSPFGGYKDSGLGREHGQYGLRELCQLKVVATEK